MQKTYPNEEEEGGDGNRSQKASDHQEWVPNRVGMRRKVTKAGWPGVTGNGSLTRIGRRRSRGIVGIIKLLGLILGSNEWHSKFLLVPFIKVRREGGGQRRR
jgi:hypothetical protein